MGRVAAARKNAEHWSATSSTRNSTLRRTVARHAGDAREVGVQPQVRRERRRAALLRVAPVVGERGEPERGGGGQRVCGGAWWCVVVCSGVLWCDQQQVSSGKRLCQAPPHHHHPRSPGSRRCRRRAGAGAAAPSGGARRRSRSARPQTAAAPAARRRGRSARGWGPVLCCLCCYVCGSGECRLHCGHRLTNTKNKAPQTAHLIVRPSLACQMKGMNGSAQ